MSPRVLALFVLGACSYSPPGSTSTGDAKVDGPSVDGPLDAAVSDLHLLITEIGVAGDEFIEIYNPTATAVDLATYYLTDENEYWKLPGRPGETIMVGNSDFLVRFPIGASIAAGAVIVVEIDVLPTYTIGGNSVGTPMVDIVSAASPQNNKLTGLGEFVVLFEWDGQHDLVRDVDIVVHGKPDADVEGNQLVEKLPIDGPDNGEEATAFAEDAMTLEMSATIGPGELSYKRRLLEATHETASGGNGITGHDETSENLDLTWDTGATAPTPGTFSPL